MGSRRIRYTGSLKHAVSRSLEEVSPTPAFAKARNFFAVNIVETLNPNS